MKKEKFYIITIVLLVIIVLFLGYDKVTSNKKNNQKDKNIETKKEKKKESKIEKLKEEDVSSFIEQINSYNSFLAGLYPISDTNNLKNQVVLEFGYMNIKDDNVNNGFTKDSIDKTIKKYFGNSLKYVHEDIECFVNDGILYKFDSDTEKYSFYGTHGHGGAGFYRSKYYFQDGEYDPNTETYSIRTKVLYGPRAEDVYGPIDKIFVNAKDSESLTNPIYNVSEDYSDDKVYDDAYESIKDKLPLTTYVFEKDDDGNYGLKSVSVE